MKVTQEMAGKAMRAYRQCREAEVSEQTLVHTVLDVVMCSLPEPRTLEWLLANTLEVDDEMVRQAYTQLKHTDKDWSGVRNALKAALQGVPNPDVLLAENAELKARLQNARDLVHLWEQQANTADGELHGAVDAVDYCVATMNTVLGKEP